MIDDDQIYIVVDIEANGPTPGLYSMLSLAAVATTPTDEIATFYRKLKPYDRASEDPGTMEWWKGQPEAWDEVSADAQDPGAVMNEFCEWVETLRKQAVFVAHPVALDYTFVSWYLYKFVNRNPFTDEKNATRTLDLRSFIAGKYGLSFNDAHRSKLDSAFFAGQPEHTHKAIDDAKGYAILIRNIMLDKITPKD